MIIGYVIFFIKMTLKLNWYFFFVVLILGSIQQDPLAQQSTVPQIAVNSTVKGQSSNAAEELLALVPSNNKPAPVMRATDVLGKDGDLVNLSKESNKRGETTESNLTEKEKVVAIVKQQKGQLVNQSPLSKTGEVQVRDGNEASQKYVTEVKTQTVAFEQSKQVAKTSDQRSNNEGKNQVRDDQNKRESKQMAGESKTKIKIGVDSRVQQKQKIEENDRNAVSAKQQKQIMGLIQQDNVEEEQNQNVINREVKPSTKAQISKIQIVEQQNKEKLLPSSDQIKKKDMHQRRQQEEAVAKNSDSNLPISAKQQEDQLVPLQNLQTQFERQEKERAQQKRKEQQDTELKVTKISEQFKPKGDVIKVNKQLQNKEGQKNQLGQQVEGMLVREKIQNQQQKNVTKQQKTVEKQKQKQKTEQKQNNIKIVPLSPDYGKPQSVKNVEVEVSPSLTKQVQRVENVVQEVNKTLKTDETRTPKEMKTESAEVDSKRAGKEESKVVKIQKQGAHEKQVVRQEDEKRSEQQKQKIKQLIKQVKNTKDSLGQDSKKEIIKYLQAEIKSPKKQDDKNLVIEPKLGVEVQEESVLLDRSTDKEQIIKEAKHNQQMDTTTIIVIIVLTFIISIPIVKELRSKNIEEIMKNKVEQTGIPSKSDLQKPENSREYNDLNNSSLYETEERLDEDII